MHGGRPPRRDVNHHLPRLLHHNDGLFRRVDMDGVILAQNGDDELSRLTERAQLADANAERYNERALTRTAAATRDAGAFGRTRTHMQPDLSTRFSRAPTLRQRTPRSTRCSLTRRARRTPKCPPARRAADVGAGAGVRVSAGASVGSGAGVRQCDGVQPSVRSGRGRAERCGHARLRTKAPPASRHIVELARKRRGSARARA